MKITNIPVMYTDQVLCLGVDYWFYTTYPPSISTSSDEQGALRPENIRHGENRCEKCSHYLFMLKRVVSKDFSFLLNFLHQYDSKNNCSTALFFSLSSFIVYKVGSIDIRCFL